MTYIHPAETYTIEQRGKWYGVRRQSDGRTLSIHRTLADACYWLETFAPFGTWATT